MRSAWIWLSTIPITDFFMVLSFFAASRSLADFQLTVDVPGHAPGCSFDCAAFGVGFDRAAQRDLAVNGDDFDVLGGERQRLVFHQVLPDLLGDLAIRLAGSLIHGSERGAVLIALIDLRIVRLRARSRR